MNNGKCLSSSVRGKKGNAKGFFYLQVLGFISKDFIIANKLVAFKSLVKLKALLRHCIYSWYNGLF